MKLRKYRPSDCAEIAELFYNTVHTVNAKDYTRAQLDAWATGAVELAVWNQSFLEHDTMLAEDSSMLVGFGDMTTTGYLDRLYVHANYQGMGIATRLLHALEAHASDRGVTIFTTHASITARPFFEKHGYHMLQERAVTRGGVSLTNYLMEKACL